MNKDGTKKVLKEMLISGEIKFETRSDFICDSWRVEKFVIIDD